MDSRYDILKLISQREDSEMSAENADLVSLASVFGRATGHGGEDEAKLAESSINVAEINEREKRIAEQWAKNNGCWISFCDIFSLGMPGPSGSESDTYISCDGFVYKVNNLMHCYDSILITLEKFIHYNMLFPDVAYTFVGFTGFEGRTIMPVFRQRYIKGCVPATNNEIDCYMAALGFEKESLGVFYNKDFRVSDVLPKNVLKDESGDVFVIDIEISPLEMFKNS